MLTRDKFTAMDSRAGHGNQMTQPAPAGGESSGASRGMSIPQVLLRIRPIELAEVLKGILRISYRETRIGSRTFWLDPASNLGNKLLTCGFHDEETASAIRSVLKPGDTFFDLGANEGYFSLLASEIVGPQGKVYSVEPQARLWPVIIRNFLLNERTNYTLIPYAIGEAKGFLDLLLFPSLNHGASSAVRSLRRRFNKVQKVGVMRFDQLLEEFRIEKISVLKVDIEGFELNALRSLGKKLEQGIIENIIVELHPAQLGRLGQSADQVLSLLQASGYEKSNTKAVEHWVRKA